ncbi:hypothetical protein [Actinocrinis sp.]|uniref:hypothetical protein n=1 Tax=Actinocrinis sp. TaxID=1920516 RepID=UPI002DDCD6C9|nr:hypothetical protein [Actinocrinis sp.]
MDMDGRRVEKGPPGRGTALEEGIVQWFTVRTVHFKDQPLERVKIRSDDMYPMHVELADRIVRIVGEDLMARAFFGGQMAEFVAALEQRLGRFAFQNLVTLSDLGMWREAFRYMAAAEKALSASGPAQPADPQDSDYRAMMEMVAGVMDPELLRRLATRQSGASEAFDQRVEQVFGPGSSTVVGTLNGLRLWREALRFMQAALAAGQGREESPHAGH